jgi:hypothetical protein
MRKLLIVSTALFIASSAPSMARDYAWCARTITNPDFGNCAFTSYRQCMATVSGQAGECIANPRLAYSQTRGPRNARGWQNNEPNGSWGNWDNGNGGNWNNSNRW